MKCSNPSGFFSPPKYTHKYSNSTFLGPSDKSCGQGIKKTFNDPPPRTGSQISIFICLLDRLWLSSMSFESLSWCFSSIWQKSIKILLQVLEPDLLKSVTNLPKFQSQAIFLFLDGFSQELVSGAVRFFCFDRGVAALRCRDSHMVSQIAVTKEYIRVYTNRRHRGSLA